MARKKRSFKMFVKAGQSLVRADGPEVYTAGRSSASFSARVRRPNQGLRRIAALSRVPKRELRAQLSDEGTLNNVQNPRRRPPHPTYAKSSCETSPPANYFGSNALIAR